MVFPHRFPNLTQFSVANNQFTGPIEEGLYYLFSNPTMMDFSWNNLTGAINPKIREMAIGTTLSYFSIYGNLQMMAEHGGLPPTYFTFMKNTFTIGDDTSYYCFDVYQVYFFSQRFPDPYHARAQDCGWLCLLSISTIHIADAREDSTVSPLPSLTFALT